MNNEPDDLISRHFDDANSAAESAALANHLASDPAAALDFVRSARVHALLEAASQYRPSRHARTVRRWVGLAAAAAVIAVGVVVAIQQFSKPDASSTSHVTVMDASHLKGRKPLPPGVKLRTVQVPAAATVLPPAKLETLMQHFYVQIDPNGQTVPEALRDLEQAIWEANLLCRRELNALHFTAGASILPPCNALSRGDPFPDVSYGHLTSPPLLNRKGST